MSPPTSIREIAIVVIVVASAAIVVAAPFALLDGGASWRDRVLMALGVLEALIAAARRVLGL